MRAKQFLIIGGIILVILSLLGMFGILGPTPDKSIFGSHWWFDNTENWVYLIWGIINFLSAFVLPATTQRHWAMLIGLIWIIIGLYTLFLGQTLLGMNFERPADSIYLLVVGIWAWWSSLKKGNMVQQMQ